MVTKKESLERLSTVRLFEDLSKADLTYILNISKPVEHDEGDRGEGAGHQHMDQGHFEIWRRGPLALDSGVYANWGTEHREAYYIRTVAHNSLQIRQPGESFAHGYSAGDTNDG